jgi:hypothetical protein
VSPSASKTCCNRFIACSPVAGMASSSGSYDTGPAARTQ